MSDLQCPATFLVLGPGGGDAVRRLAGARLAAVYASPEGRAVADAVAGASGLPVRELDGSSYVVTLGELADLHRGETVALVLPDEAVLSLAGPAPGSGARRGEGPLEVVVDSDGRRVRTWTGAPAGAPLRD